MILGVIAPFNAMPIMTEHTQFEVALGYIAMRYVEYVNWMKYLSPDKRDIVLMHMPDHIIREDHYYAAARKLNPKIIVATPANSSDEKYENYLNALRFVGQTGLSAVVAPHITTVDDNKHIAVYLETAREIFVNYDALDKVPAKVVTKAYVLGLPDKETILKYRPKGIITSLPIVRAIMGLSMFGDTVTTTANFNEEYFNLHLNADILTHAVENVKELLNVAPDRKK